MDMRAQRTAKLAIGGVVMAGALLLSACSSGSVDTARVDSTSATEQPAQANDESSTAIAGDDAAVHFSTLTGVTAEAACETLFGSPSELADASSLDGVFDSAPFFLDDWSEYWYAEGNGATLQCEAIGVPEEGGTTVPGDHRGAFSVMIDVNEPGELNPVNCSAEDHPEHFYNVCIKDDKVMLRANMKSAVERPLTPDEYNHVEQFLRDNVRTSVSW